ncbi:extradiol ring-cleavage dioxygenase [Schinkia azotoformans]|uniref:Extradiol ring-cleavage dioxygenase class III protein subunit B n=1 Tax=Schinkia azotoformans LMG 9581 TaxID=1131731 RepID=K6BXC4_SCHAZ|nr:extradiol ring-cleavage dioxygenase class III protein subunit B [Schinkia azotoformans]EKN63560.1 extradiol ring-cleavage dioxygenase class III protein subunit B [Schinkia azotoformans LMG 9581]MEC1638860.1 extradiol ring-cleavage dioxygenase [Schinkia azotoformans]MEC1720886.1 extradiol ring-cleavage dioxygenase [Schinkia azotoformans]MEC1946825.1 extradiol ring-cleavage dioxygenase [Schinkia azotoformans]MED4412137.1 extradiol ring-cleavage dioxygenase [Schinkia azotoformans]
MSIVMSVISPHVPSICHDEHVPEFQKEMVAGMKAVSKKIYEKKPDLVVLVSCHWPSTFNHLVDCTPVHKGILTAQECPDLVSDVPYNYPGDQEIAEKLVQAGQSAGLNIVGFNDSSFVWDYGTVVPLRHLVPNEDIPVINLSVVLVASLEETYKWGQEIRKVLEKTDKKVVFVSSGALSHNVVRGRENKPTISEQALDKQYVELVMNKKYKEAYEMLPQYAAAAKVESGGRHLAMLSAILDENDEPKYYADGQSSGSWNPVITFEKQTTDITA